MSKNVAELLKEKVLRNTEIRRSLLQHFLDHDHALSHADLDGLSDHLFDRVTVYRTLKTFVEKGILHEVIDDEMKTKYSLCEGNCTEHIHHDNHLHFKCEYCERTYCLTHSTVPSFNLPNDYRATSVKVLISGKCANCN